MSDSDKHSGLSGSGDVPPVEGEYRLIPVEAGGYSGAGTSGEVVNLRELMANVRSHQSTIIIITAAFLVLGLLYAAISPIEYRSEAKVLPEQQGSRNQLGDLFQSYGGMLGLGDAGGLGSGPEGLSPQVYPQIVQSLTFQEQMLRDTVYFEGLASSVTLYNYFKDKVGPIWGSWTGSGTGEPDLSRLPPDLRSKLTANEINAFTEKELQVITELRQRIDLEFDTETGVISVTARMPDALASAQVCERAITLLTQYVREYRTRKAQNVLDFANEQFEIGRERFISAQNELAAFKDQNINLASEQAQSRQQYLQAEFDLAYSVYNNVAQKRIQARMNLEQNTPVFQTLQAADVPLEPAEPRWFSIIIFSVAAGLLVSFLYIAARMIYDNYNRTEPA